jgi:hypothetical protein
LIGDAVQQEVMLQPAKANKRVAQQEVTQQPDSVLKGGGKARGCGMVRSHIATNRANGRQQQVEGVNTSRGREAAQL